MPERERDQAGETVPPIYANYDAIVASEVASEIVNRGRGIVYDRIHKLMAAGDEDGVGWLRAGPAKRLFDLLRSIDYRDPAHVQSVIDTWGPLVQDEAALWEALDD
jgi:hypothetical protein